MSKYKNGGHGRGRMMICDRRHDDGTLDLRGEPQPTMLEWTEREISDHFFQKNPDSKSAGNDEIYAWFKTTYGWTFRHKTW